MQFIICSSAIFLIALKIANLTSRYPNHEVPLKFTLGLLIFCNAIVIALAFKESKKIYFLNQRFSRDLTFSVIDTNRDQLVQIFNNLGYFCQDKDDQLIKTVRATPISVSVTLDNNSITISLLSMIKVGSFHVNADYASKVSVLLAELKKNNIEWLEI